MKLNLNALKNITDINNEFALDKPNEEKVLLLAKSIANELFKIIKKNDEQGHFSKKEVEILNFYWQSINISTHYEIEDRPSYKTVVLYLEKFWNITKSKIDFETKITFPHRKINENITFKNEEITNVNYDALILKNRMYDEYLDKFYYEVAYSSKQHGYNQKTKKRIYVHDDVLLAKDETYKMDLYIAEVLTSGFETGIKVKVAQDIVHNPKDHPNIPTNITLLKNKIVEETGINALDNILFLKSIEIEDENLKKFESELMSYYNKLKSDVGNFENVYVFKSIILNWIIYFKIPHLQKYEKINETEYNPMVFEFFTKNPRGTSFTIKQKKTLSDMLIKLDCFSQEDFWGIENLKQEVDANRNGTHYFEIENDLKIEEKFPDNNRFNKQKVSHLYSKVVNVEGSINTFYKHKLIIDYVNKLNSENEIMQFDFENNLINIWNDINYSDHEVKEKKKEITNLLRNKYSFLIGNAGTGKTRLAALYMYIMLKRDDSIKVDYVAPTHKAKAVFKNISEKFSVDNSFYRNINHMTVSSFVKKNKCINEIRCNFDLRDKENTVLIIDEISMISNEEWMKIFCSSSKYLKVLFVGDENQLPPINDMESISLILKTIDKKMIFKLKKQQRQTDSRLIEGVIEPVKNSCKIKDASYIETFKDLGEYTSTLKKYMQRGFKIITPVNNGVFGVETINNFKALKLEEYQISVGTSFIVNKTPNDKISDAIYNNMEFRVTSIDTESNPSKFYIDKVDGDGVTDSYDGTIWGKENGSFYFEFEKIDHNDPEISLSSCISVHKSQGSTIEKVLFLIPYGYEVDKNLFYTAVSRASEELKVLVHTDEVEKIIYPKNNLSKVE